VGKLDGIGRTLTIDVAVGGFTMKNPRKKDLGVTRPYSVCGKDDEHKHVMFVPQGENAFLIALEKFLGPCVTIKED
jgi:hypothetical protein|tara:strand:- start:1474 stop:1701 length:228 start_codon:yes stop_codon:yes gene_type:complete